MPLFFALFQTALLSVPWLGLAIAGPQDNREGDPKIHEGITLIYNNRLDEAERLFRKVIADNSGKPIGHFYLAMVTWSRLVDGFWGPKEVEEYSSRIDRTIEVANRLIDRQAADSYDYFYLGGALGFKGRFELMRRNWLTSFLDAREAVATLNTCLRMDPDNKDVLLGIGTFDYYTARLSGVLKFLSYLLIHKGDREEGLRKLHIAANEAVYSASEAKSMLVHIYLFLEQQPAKAAVLAEQLSAEYHGSALYRHLQGVCYMRLGREDSYRGVLNEFATRGNRTDSLSSPARWQRRALYLEAAYELFHQRYPAARTVLERILANPDRQEDPAMIAWPILKIGMSYDLEGARDRAEGYYKQVIGMENGAGAQFLAERLLGQAPARDDPFIGY